MGKDFFDIGFLDTRYEKKKNRILNDKELSQTNKDLILKYLQDSELGKTVKKGQKRVIGSGRNLQVAVYFTQMCKIWFKGKDLNKITSDDMEKFILDLDKGILLSDRGKPYSSETKANIKKFIRKFYKYLYGDGKNFPELVDWIDTSRKHAEIEAVPNVKEGIWQIIELIPDIKRKALLWVLFDSGFREGEIINCKLKDIEKRPDGIFYISCKHSKTKPRSVSLPLSSELLERWINEHPDKNNGEAHLWQTTRTALQKTIKLYGYKAHKQNITVHMFRHTSATYWAPKLDRVNFCKRFGWSYNSSSPDRYIDFAKVGENKIIDLVKNETLTNLSIKLEEQKIDNLALKEELSRQRKAMGEFIKILAEHQKEKGSISFSNIEEIAKILK